MKNMLQLLALATIMSGVTSCSEDESGVLLENEKEQLYADYAFSVGLPMEEIEKRLSESDSITVPMVAEYISGTMPQTKGELIPYQGTITEEKGIKTLWKYNVGENLVPRVFCGSNIMTDMTISNRWKISLTIDLTNEDYAVRGFEGEWTGWSGANLTNTQERTQLNGGTATSPEFYTYVWKIISDISGRNYGYTNCYVPFADEKKARIYVRIYQ